MNFSEHPLFLFMFVLESIATFMYPEKFKFNCRLQDTFKVMPETIQLLPSESDSNAKED